MKKFLMLVCLCIYAALGWAACSSEPQVDGIDGPALGIESAHLGQACDDRSNPCVDYNAYSFLHLNTCCGTCLDLDNDPLACGGCNIHCPSNVGMFKCEEGVCVCEDDTPDLCLGVSGSYCTDLQEDTDNCGECGLVCGAGRECRYGECICDSGAGYFDCSGTCKHLTDDEDNCGGCGIECDPGVDCIDSKCHQPCTYQQDCPSGKICTGTFAGNDAVTDGQCDVVGCTQDSDCAAYEPTGGISGWSMGTTDDNKMRCTPGGFCVAASSDPLFCGTGFGNVCGGGAPYETCMGYSSSIAGCGGAGHSACSVAPGHAKTTPGYWRDCP